MTYYANSKEGATDYILARPALVLSYQASGSVVAGKAVVFDAGGSSTVYQPTAVTVASGTQCAGLALSAAATGKIVDVLVWGFAKNLPAVAGWTPATGDRFQVSGSSQFTSITTGSFLGNPYVVAGTVVTGSGAGGVFQGFIDCLK